MTNVLKVFAGKENWPQLRHLTLRYLSTSVADYAARGHASNV